VAKTTKTKLTSLSEIYAFFRQNQTPITFLSPTPYNILGLGRWINKFEYINFFDSFDGSPSKDCRCRANTAPTSSNPSRT
jgi:hypothetical protein